MDKKKRTILISSAAGCLVIIAALMYYLFFASFSTKNGNCCIIVDQDDTADSVYTKLRAEAAPRQMVGLRTLGALLGYGSRVQPGRYQAGDGVSTLRLMRNLRGGHEAAVRLVIPIVNTTDELAERFAEKLGPSAADFRKIFSDAALLKDFGLTKETLPTLFIPNTYEVYWNISAEGLMRRMKKEHDAFWTDSRRAQAEDEGLSPEEAYTLASIVEKETANDGERAAIAGMYLNRLHQGMRLQADPTVKFALGQFDLKRITHDHLKVDSPYNTYRNEGLPPGPICIPSLASIEAVLSPEHHSYIYMCAKEDLSGTHNFAETYEEHLQNARRYAEALDKRNIH